MTDRFRLAQQIRRQRARQRVELQQRDREIGYLSRQLADIQLQNIRHRGKILTELKRYWVALNVRHQPGPLKAAVTATVELLKLSRATVYAAVRPYLDRWK